MGRKIHGSHQFTRLETGNDLVAEPLQYSSDFCHSFKMKINEISLYFNKLGFHLSILPKSNYLPLCCFTGISYIDIKTLTPEHFEKDNTGRIWIKKRRVKTGVLSRIPLLPIAKLILDKYKGGEKLLPIQDPADINKYLKDIAILCGINKRICFHTSRHTFASTITLANNISLEVVSKMLGHTNTRMTAHYAKLIDKCIGEQMDKLMDTFTGASDY